MRQRIHLTRWVSQPESRQPLSGAPPKVNNNLNSGLCTILLATRHGAKLSNSNELIELRDRLDSQRAVPPRLGHFRRRFGLCHIHRTYLTGASGGAL